DALWSHQIFWGSHRIYNGVIATIASAWRIGTLWGSATSVDGDTVVWGTVCDPMCQVWGPSSPSDTAVWGTSADGDTVVWGTTDGDTVVWGTSCSDPSCEPVVWQ